MRIGFALFCGVAAYLIWLLAGNIYVRDILLVTPTTPEMASGQLVASIIGGYLLVGPFFSARGFHRRHNAEIVAEVHRTGCIGYLPAVAGAVVFAWGVGIVPEVLSAPVANYIAGVLR